MRRFPHSNESEESMKVELWAGVTPKQVEPGDMDLDEERS